MVSWCLLKCKFLDLVLRSFGGNFCKKYCIYIFLNFVLELFKACEYIGWVSIAHWLIFREHSDSMSCQKMLLVFSATFWEQISAKKIHALRQFFFKIMGTEEFFWSKCFVDRAAGESWAIYNMGATDNLWCFLLSLTAQKAEKTSFSKFC